MLEVKDISVKYNIIKVLQGVSFKVEQGKKISIVGANAAGKSTVLKTISGLLHPVEGSIEFMGERIDNLKPFEITSRGISHVPEGRKIFSKLTVEENLLIGAHVRESKQEIDRSLDEMFALFSVLKERRRQKGETLSGGEQQMLAIARGLMSRPRLLMLDEPSLGLSPILSHKVIEICKEISSKGTTTLLVEQKVKDALQIADWAYVLQTGRVIMEGTGAELLSDDMIRKAYLGL
ncbi:MAG: ABC transporter ATP-binding protein [Desulfobacterales bacterium PC51MH44]|nr:MAG: ABC transporter ATP-binding protein [Desulfobacterales bacterium PC51MH44]